jgi:ATP-dependent DNA helicase RecQ
MFRTNDEVFRAFNILQKMDFGSVRLRIQGSKGSLYKSREFQYIEREMFGTNLTGNLSSSYINDYNIYKEEIKSKYPAWDKYLLDLYHCLLYEFETEVDEYSTKEDLIDFIKEIANKDDGQIGKLYYNNISKINKGTDHQEIVLTTMHKVKGLEFDAVLIPASFSNLPLTNNDLSESDIEELIEEERRLYYVAYTRAKKSLITINWHREDALFRGDKYVFEENILSKLGISIPDGTDKLFIGWGATELGDKMHDFIEREVSIGDELVLTRPKKNWVLGVKGKMIGMSSNDLSKYITNKIGVDKKVLKGFSVSGIYVLSYDEVLNSDHLNDTNFIDMWSDVAKKRGYIYMIDFSGYGKEI